MKDKKLIIFDCDGVLIDSELIANQSDAEFLTKIGYPITTEENIKTFIGQSYSTVRDQVLKAINIDIFQLTKENTQRKSSLFKRFEKELKPLTQDFIEAIHDQFKICIASSSPKQQILKCLEITKLHHYFHPDQIYTAEMVDKGKPAPDLFQYAMQEMGYLPQDTVIIEDSPAGIQAAQSAGVDVIGFLGGSHAQYEWYEERIRIYNIPLIYNQNQLIDLFS